MKANEEIIHVGAVIEADTTKLRREAQEAHKRWLAEPTPAARRAYGFALRDHGKATRNKNVTRYAESLLDEADNPQEVTGG